MTGKPGLSGHSVHLKRSLCMLLQRLPYYPTEYSVKTQKKNTAYFINISFFVAVKSFAFSV